MRDFLVPKHLSSPKRRKKSKRQKVFLLPLLLLMRTRSKNTFALPNLSDISDLVTIVISTGYNQSYILYIVASYDVASSLTEERLKCCPWNDWN